MEPKRSGASRPVSRHTEISLILKSSKTLIANFQKSRQRSFVDTPARLPARKGRSGSKGRPARLESRKRKTRPGGSGSTRKRNRGRSEKASGGADRFRFVGTKPGLFADSGRLRSNFRLGGATRKPNLAGFRRGLVARRVTRKFREPRCRNPRLRRVTAGRRQRLF